jgi:hypothetical protein
MQQSSTEYPLPQPTEQVVRNRIESFVIFRLNLIPNESANIGVSLKNASAQTISVLNLLMEGEAYAQWTTDDYLIQWITDQIYLAYPDVIPPEPEPVIPELIGE